MYRFTFILLLSFLASNIFGQSPNKLLLRSYWKEKPTLETIQSDVALGNDPAAFDAHKFNPVTWAILEDASTEIVLFLLKCTGNDVNLKAHDGRTPIFWAAYRGNVALMQELIKNGATLNVVDDHGMSVVNFAASTGQTATELYELCVKNGVQFPNEKTPEGATPLLLVIPYLKNPSEIDYFTQKGLKLSHTDEAGNNAFTYAARTGNEVMLTFLKEKGLNPKANNDAAMLFACKGTRNNPNNVETFQLLEKLGVSPTAEDREHQNALHYLSSSSRDTTVYQYFLSSGVDLHQRDVHGATPLLKAVASNSSEVIHFLLRSGALPTAMNSTGENALHIAVKRGDSRILKTIIDTGIDLNGITNDGLTALHIAAMTAKNLELLTILVNAGADRNLRTPFDETAFDLSLENEIIQSQKESLQFLKP